MKRHTKRFAFFVVVLLAVTGFASVDWNDVVAGTHASSSDDRRCVVVRARVTELSSADGYSSFTRAFNRLIHVRMHKECFSRETIEQCENDYVQVALTGYNMDLREGDSETSIHSEWIASGYLARAIRIMERRVDGHPCRGHRMQCAEMDFSLASYALWSDNTNRDRRRALERLQSLSFYGFSIEREWLIRELVSTLTLRDYPSVPEKNLREFRWYVRQHSSSEDSGRLDLAEHMMWRNKCQQPAPAHLLGSSVRSDQVMHVLLACIQASHQPQSEHVIEKIIAAGYDHFLVFKALFQHLIKTRPGGALQFALEHDEVLGKSFVHRAETACRKQLREKKHVTLVEDSDGNIQRKYRLEECQ